MEFLAVLTIMELLLLVEIFWLGLWLAHYDESVLLQLVYLFLAELTASLFRWIRIVFIIFSSLNSLLLTFTLLFVLWLVLLADALSILFLLETSLSSVVLVLLLFGLSLLFLDGLSNLFSNWLDLWWLLYNRSRFFSHKGNFFYNHWFWFFLRNRFGLFNFMMFLFLFSLLLLLKDSAHNLLLFMLNQIAAVLFNMSR